MSTLSPISAPYRADLAISTRQQPHGFRVIYNPKDGQVLQIADSEIHARHLFEAYLFTGKREPMNYTPEQIREFRKDL